tara:strand:- start:224 stop:934 length:711 start_codon:yes stop_codon:yes gene_type:complete
MEKARKWYADHITVDDSGKRPKVIVHPDRDNLDKFKVVHGTVTNKWSGDAEPVLHAWVQMGDMIFDDQTKFTKPNGIDKATYYDVFSAEPKNEYTAKQAIAKCHTKGIEGPWDAKSIAKMKARDAWLGESRMNIEQIIKEELKAVLNEDDDYDDFPSANDLQDLENTRRWESDRLNADDQHGSLEQIAGYADDVNNLAKHVLAGEGSLSDAMYDIQTKMLLIKQLVKQHQREMENL